MQVHHWAKCGFDDAISVSGYYLLPIGSWADTPQSREGKHFEFRPLPGSVLLWYLGLTLLFLTGWWLLRNLDSWCGLVHCLC